LLAANEAPYVLSFLVVSCRITASFNTYTTNHKQNACVLHPLRREARNFVLEKSNNEKMARSSTEPLVARILMCVP